MLERRSVRLGLTAGAITVLIVFTIGIMIAYFPDEVAASLFIAVVIGAIAGLVVFMNTGE